MQNSKFKSLLIKQFQNENTPLLISHFYYKKYAAKVSIFSASDLIMWINCG
jgi:hypothetical protein